MQKKMLWGTALVFMLALTGCGDSQEEEKTILVTQETELPEYSLAVVTREDVELTQRIRCVCQPASSQDVSFAVGGEMIAQVYVDKGDTVRAGDLLAELATDSAREEILQVQHEIERNELLLEQTYEDIQYDLDTKNLEFSYYDWGWIGPDDDYLSLKLERDADLAEALADIEESYRYTLEDLNDAIEVGNMRLTELEESLSQAYLYANISGTVSYVESNLRGTTAREGETIITIQNDTGTVFTSDQVEYASYFTQGETYEMAISLGSSAGTYEVVPTGSQSEQLQFAITGAGSDANIEVGAAGTIQLVLEKREQVLCIPASTVHYAQDKAYVYVLDDQGFRTAKWVEIGLRGDRKTEILSGLSEGEKVIEK